MTSKTQKATAVLSSIMLASGALAAVPAIASADESTQAVESQQVTEDGSLTTSVKAEGAFSWQQSGLSSLQYVKTVFQRAASLCANMPAYKLAVINNRVWVSGPGGTFSASIDEIAADEGAASYVLACACASNAAGGGAVANAQVEGVSLESLANLAGAN